jgi:toxin ParE1/3/4
MQLKWSVLAQQDRETIFDYIEADSPQAAIAVDDRIHAQIETLIDFPEMGRPGRIAGTRELTIQRTPYIAAYLVREDHLLILRLLHGAQMWPEIL